MPGSETAIEAVVGIGVCGNAVIEGSEDCEGSDLGGQSCSSLGFSGGDLSCDIACSFDISMCILPTVLSKPLYPSFSRGITAPNLLTDGHVNLLDWLTPTLFPEQASLPEASVTPSSPIINTLISSGNILDRSNRQQLQTYFSEEHNSIASSVANYSTFAQSEYMFFIASLIMAFVWLLRIIILKI